jgi:hypothetical protein
MKSLWLLLLFLTSFACGAVAPKVTTAWSASRYDLGGGYVDCGGDSGWVVYSSSTGDGISKGSIMRRKHTNGSFGAATVIFNDTSVYDNVNCGTSVIGDTAFVFFTQYKYGASEGYKYWGYVKANKYDWSGQSAFIKLDSGTTIYKRVTFTGVGCIDGNGRAIKPYTVHHNDIGRYTRRYMWSTDSGDTWTDFRIDSTADTSNELSIEYIGNNRLIATSSHFGSDYELRGGPVYQMTSGDNGATWTTITLTNMGGATGTKTAPVLAYDNKANKIYCSFLDRSNAVYYLYYAHPDSVYGSASKWSHYANVKTFDNRYAGYGVFVKLKNKYLNVFFEAIGLYATKASQINIYSVPQAPYFSTNATFCTPAILTNDSLGRLSSFPALLQPPASSSDFWAKVDSLGNSIRIFNDSGAELTYDLWGFDKTNKTWQALYCKTNIDSLRDSACYVLAGGDNAGITKTATWSNGYVGVWPLYETTGTLNDRTANALHGTLNGSGHTRGSAVKVGKGISFMGATTPYIEIADNDKLSFVEGGGADSTYTMTGWFSITRRYKVNPTISKLGTSSVREYRFYLDSLSNYLNHLCYKSDGSAYIGNSPSGAFNNDSIVRYFQHTYNGNKLYTGMANWVNGLKYSNTNANSGVYTGMSNTATPLLIGGWPQVSQYLDGKMNMVRISAGVRSDAWLYAEYLAENSPSTFTSYWPAEATIKVPVIDSIKTRDYGVGDTVTIYGYNFYGVQSNGYIKIDSSTSWKTCVVVNWKDSTLTAIIPDVADGAHNLQVFNNDSKGDTVGITITGGLAVTSHPQSAIDTIAKQHIFTVAATGTPPISYQWRSKRQAGSWGNVGTNSTSYTTGALVWADTGLKVCAIVNGSISSDTATLTVADRPAVIRSISPRRGKPTGQHDCN